MGTIRRFVSESPDGHFGPTRCQVTPAGQDLAEQESDVERTIQLTLPFIPSRQGREDRLPSPLSAGGGSAYGGMEKGEGDF